MQHSSTHHHHGIVVGVFLALCVAAAGFLVQADMAKALHGGGHAVVIAGVVAAIVAIVLLRLRSR